MNLPDYLAPAPRFNEKHDLDWRSVYDEPASYHRVVLCICGEKITVSLFDSVRVGVAGQAFWDKWEVHYTERLAAFRFAEKWGGLDKAPTAE